MQFFNIQLPEFFWSLFLCCFLLLVICGYFLNRKSQRFEYLRGTVDTRFSMMDLEFPGTTSSISNIMAGIQKLSPHKSRISYKALKNSLYLDFLFMAGLYPCIFLLCINTALRMHHAGRVIFLLLAWSQVFAWIFDILENLYLLRKLKYPVPARVKMHYLYKKMVTAKWFLATLGAFCSLFALLYYWVSGSFKKSSVNAGLIILGILCLALIYFTYTLIKSMADNKDLAGANSK